MLRDAAQIATPDSSPSATQEFRSVHRALWHAPTNIFARSCVASACLTVNASRSLGRRWSLPPGSDRDPPPDGKSKGSRMKGYFFLPAANVAFPASLTCDPSNCGAAAATLSFLGFRTSRLLRIWPFAMGLSSICLDDDCGCDVGPFQMRPQSGV